MYTSQAILEESVVTAPRWTGKICIERKKQKNANAPPHELLVMPSFDFLAKLDSSKTMRYTAICEHSSLDTAARRDLHFTVSEREQHFACILLYALQNPWLAGRIIDQGSRSQHMHAHTKKNFLVRSRIPNPFSGPHAAQKRTGTYHLTSPDHQIQVSDLAHCWLDTHDQSYRNLWDSPPTISGTNSSLTIHSDNKNLIVIEWKKNWKDLDHFLNMVCWSFIKVMKKRSLLSFLLRGSITRRTLQFTLVLWSVQTFRAFLRSSKSW